MSKLLNEAYFRYPEGGRGVRRVLRRRGIRGLRSDRGRRLRCLGDGQAVVDAANRGSLMMWSADPATQALFDDTRLQGVLPQTNEGATVIGVYFRDRSASKIDYYLHTEATVTTNACTPDARPTRSRCACGSTSPTISSCPATSTASLYDFYRTEVFLYGPVGAATTAVEVPEPGLETTTGPSVADLGRPAEKFTVDLERDQTALVRATFTGIPGEYGPTEVRTTPMINATAVRWRGHLRLSRVCRTRGTTLGGHAHP